MRVMFKVKSTTRNFYFDVDGNRQNLEIGKGKFFCVEFDSVYWCYPDGLIFEKFNSRSPGGYTRVDFLDISRDEGLELIKTALSRGYIDMSMSDSEIWLYNF